MFSFDYYSAVFNHHPARVATMKGLILIDFKNMESRLLSAYEDKRIDLMKTELHKMYPIASNLKFVELLALIEEYRKHERHTRDLEPLNDRLSKCLSFLYEALEGGANGSE